MMFFYLQNPHPKAKMFPKFSKLRPFIQAISIAILQVLYYSEVLNPTQHGYRAGISRRSATGNCE